MRLARTETTTAIATLSASVVAGVVDWVLFKNASNGSRTAYLAVLLAVAIGFRLMGGAMLSRPAGLVLLVLAGVNFALVGVIAAFTAGLPLLMISAPLTGIDLARGGLGRMDTVTVAMCCAAGVLSLLAFDLGLAATSVS